jgi:hypothetical protein
MMPVLTTAVVPVRVAPSPPLSARRQAELQAHTTLFDTFCL